MSENYFQVLCSLDIYGCLSGVECELILQCWFQGCQYLVVVDVCFKEDLGGFCCYDDEQDVWCLLVCLFFEVVFWGCVICSFFNYFFVVFGCQGFGYQFFSCVFCYNLFMGIWSEVCLLNQVWLYCWLVVLDGYLYVIGGECLNLVECYDFCLDCWDFVLLFFSDMFVLVYMVIVCVKEIFVIGGLLCFLLFCFLVQEQ